MSCLLYTSGHVAKNDNILTDISDISRNDNIIYLYTDNDNDVFYVYAFGATSGAVKRDVYKRQSST